MGYNVAMLVACPYPTGQGTQALVGELARSLNARGHRIHLICYGHGQFERKEPFAIHRCLGLPGYRRLRSGPDWGKPVLDGLLLAKAIKTIRTHRCQLLHAHNYEAASLGFVVSKICRIPWLYHAHNLMEAELPSYFKRPSLKALGLHWGRLLDRTLPSLADRVIALHQKLGKELIQSGVCPSKLHVIEPGIDLEGWPFSPVSKSAWPTVVYSGNLDAYQDLSVLFEAMPRVLKRITQARLVLATPNSETAARALVEKHKAQGYCSVVQAISKTQVGLELQKAWVAVCPRSSSAGFPMKNLNALAMGIPLVASQGSAFGIVPGITGEVVPDHDPDQLASCLIELLSNPTKLPIYAKHARQLAQKRYSQKRMACEVEVVWRKLVSSKVPSDLE